LNAVGRNLVVPAIMWGVLVQLRLPLTEIREGVVTLAIPSAAVAVILAVQFKIAEQEMASSLLLTLVQYCSLHTDDGCVYVSDPMT
jgi:malonate transporter and related proteins